ncbi:MAG: hypothetical protein JWO06_3461 [Bacteroidota bacterium]|nr:hypothetical protein [Bacteroidota bacterium]
MSNSIKEIKRLIAEITQAKAKGSFKNYIEYIRFPYYKNLQLNGKITFDFPLTVLVGPNGSGKSSALHGIYGAPEGYSPGHYWFATKVDPIEDDTNSRHCLIYAYKGEDGLMKEVLKLRIGTAKGSHYWEPSRPLKKYDMETMAGARNATIQKNVIYLDFRSELSAFDKFFYFSNFRITKTFKSRQDSIRLKSKHLKYAIDNNAEWSYFKRKIGKPVLLKTEELEAVNTILGKIYIECKLINHNLYSVVDGLTIYFKTSQINYSEAFAGRGEFAVVKLVHAILNAPNYSLIILDEPEVSLHPGAQERLLEFLLNQTLRKKLQVVISTHSPKFVQSLPDNALKLFHPIDGVRFGIQNTCHYLEAFHLIGEEIKDSDKKVIVVEDVLAKELLVKIIESMGQEFVLMFNVEFYAGGVDRILVRAVKYCEENDLRKFIMLDGDKSRTKIDPQNLTQQESNTFTKIQELIQAATDMNFKNLGFSINSKGDQGGDEKQKIEISLKYLAFLYDHLEYFPPNMIPEDLIWNKDCAKQLLTTIGVAYVDFAGSSKEKMVWFSEQFIGDHNQASYQTCCKMFINDFVRRRDGYYQAICKSIVKFKELQ